MNITKTLFATAAAACFSMSASAMQPLAEEQLSEVTGQAVAILATLNVSIDDITYTDTNVGNEGSFIMSDIQAHGLLAVTLDLLTEANFTAEVADFVNALPNVIAAGHMGALGAPAGTLYTATAVSGLLRGTAGLPGSETGFYDGSDVVKIAIPQLGLPVGTGALVDVTIGGMAMANSEAGKTWGSLDINGLNLQGTTVYIWAH